MYTSIVKMDNANISTNPPAQQTCELLGEFGAFGWVIQLMNEAINPFKE